MKYCLSSRQSKEYLEKADEIYVFWHDRKQIIDLGHDYTATIILETPKDMDNWTEVEHEIVHYKNLAPNGFAVCLKTSILMEHCIANKVDFFFDYPVKTPYEATLLKDLGVKYIYADAPLFFDQDFLNKLGVQRRANPRKISLSPFGDPKACYGIWIRPEDTEYYKDTTIEFLDNENFPPKKIEQALYRVYAEEKEWRGMMSLIIPNFSKEINRLVEPDLVKYRLNCEQTCQSGGSCRICEKAMTIAGMKGSLDDYLDAMNVILEEDE